MRQACSRVWNLPEMQVQTLPTRCYSMSSEATPNYFRFRRGDPILPTRFEIYREVIIELSAINWCNHIQLELHLSDFKIASRNRPTAGTPKPYVVLRRCLPRWKERRLWNHFHVLKGKVAVREDYEQFLNGCPFSQDALDVYGITISNRKQYVVASGGIQ
jgi:hypothetical protein